VIWLGYQGVSSTCSIERLFEDSELLTYLLIISRSSSSSNYGFMDSRSLAIHGFKKFGKSFAVALVLWKAQQFEQDGWTSWWTIDE